VNPEQRDPHALGGHAPEREPEASTASGTEPGTTASEPDLPTVAAAPRAPLTTGTRPAPERPTTGEGQVDAATALLGTIADLPVADHVAVFEDAHRQLHDALADLDEG
jgi:hypothetical protein